MNIRKLPKEQKINRKPLLLYAYSYTCAHRGEREIPCNFRQDNNEPDHQMSDLSTHRSKKIKRLKRLVSSPLLNHSNLIYNFLIFKFFVLFINT